MDADQREAGRDLVLATLSLVVVTGGGILAALPLALHEERIGAWISEVTAGYPGWVAVAAGLGYAVVLLGTLVLGLFAGAGLLFLVVRLFVGRRMGLTRDEAAAKLLRPEIPMVTPALRRIFRWVYRL